MPRGRDSLAIVIEAGELVIDYNWHRYSESRERGVEYFFDWDYEGLYLDGKQVSETEVRRLLPDWENRAQSKIEERH